LRIIRAARELGVETVAVYSEADRIRCTCVWRTRRLHRASSFGGELSAHPPDHQRREITAADAIIRLRVPLRERAFRRSVRVVPHTLHRPDVGDDPAHGDKAVARKTMVKAGVPVTPGSEGTLESPDEAAAVAAELGYPVIIKAAAGGGGKGMRIASDESRSGTHSHGPRRGGGQFRERRGLPRALRGEASSHRVPDHR